MHHARRTTATLAAAVAAGTLALAGCAGPGTAAADDSVVLDYWLWDAVVRRVRTVGRLT